jgi:hypothetical protein
MYCTCLCLLTWYISIFVTSVVQRCTISAVADRAFLNYESVVFYKWLIILDLIIVVTYISVTGS